MQPKGLVSHVVCQFRRFMSRIFLSRCDALMFSCTGNRRYIEGLGLRKPLFPITCAVDNDFYHAQWQENLPHRKQIREGLGARPEDLVVAFVGRLISRKRPRDLVEAARILTTNRTGHIRLLFVGEGAEKPHLERMCSTWAIPTTFVGFQNQNDIGKYYTAADVVCILSDYDPSPKVLNEAMNFRLAAIVTDVVGTAPDLVQEGVNGFIIQVANTHLLAEHLSHLAMNRDVLTTMGKHSKRIVGSATFSQNVTGIEDAVTFVTRQGRERRYRSAP
jgi:glycosyltransferase involved in cell wall biosynthesis